MHGSGFVDAALEVLPRRLVRGVVILAVALMSLTGWWKPVEWYVNDKAAAHTEVLSEMVVSIMESSNDGP